MLATLQLVVQAGEGGDDVVREEAGEGVATLSVTVNVAGDTVAALRHSPAAAEHQTDRPHRERLSVKVRVELAVLSVLTQLATLGLTRHTGLGAQQVVRLTEQAGTGAVHWHAHNSGQADNQQQQQHCLLHVTVTHKLIRRMSTEIIIEKLTVGSTMLIVLGPGYRLGNI